MLYSSYSRFLSKSYHRFAILLFAIHLIPVPSINAIPVDVRNADLEFYGGKQQINFDDDYDVIDDANAFIPEQEVISSGLLGCKYDLDICNENEVCFDDQLFGQCWDGSGSPRKAFAFRNSVDRLANDRLIALEYTRKFLHRYHLGWKDYVTQCILLQILTDQRQFDLHSLELIYSNCLNEDEFKTIEQEHSLDRRRLQKDSYTPVKSVGGLFYGSHSSSDVPVYMKYNQPSYLQPPFGQQSYIDDGDIVLEAKPSNFIIEERFMKEPSKLIMQVKESPHDLKETLKINNHKYSPSVASSEPIELKKPVNLDQTISSLNMERYYTIETSQGFIIIDRNFKNHAEGNRFLAFIADMNMWPTSIFADINTIQNLLTFRVLNNAYQITANSVAKSIVNNQKYIENQLGIRIIDCGIGNPNQGTKLSVQRSNGSSLAIAGLVICAWVLFLMCLFSALYFIKRNDRIRNKINELTHIKGLSSDYYQDLCRQHAKEQQTHRKSSAVVHTTASINSHSARISEVLSAQNSTASCAEEPMAPFNMDIMTGHLILSYMEDHLCNRHRLESEWESFATEKNNDPEEMCSVALLEINERKNRYKDCIPYDHARIELANNEDGDYINASKISDCDPKCKYIATQGPMPNTTNDFWQMVWEQGSCVIVMLTRPIENGITMCHHYWPVEGSKQYNDFEINLVSEHISSDDYVVRSFYMKNTHTMESRTITQFQFLTWDELCNPPSAKSVLDFRRKVNKSIRGTSSPLIVHCNDGVGRTGTYILIDIVLNRIYRGARELNIAATLEHIRDQRPRMIKTKEQFEFVFVAVAEELTDLLRLLSQ